MNYKIKKFRNENYFVLYNLSDEIVCYFNDFDELSKFISYSLRDLIHEYNKHKTDVLTIIIDNKKYKLATFC